MQPTPAICHAVALLGGQTATAKAVGATQQEVQKWVNNIPPRAPAPRCPAIERALDARVLCEELRPDVRWERVPDPHWPRHGRPGLPEGRPCHDYVGPTPAPDTSSETPSP